MRPQMPMVILSNKNALLQLKWKLEGSPRAIGRWGVMSCGQVSNVVGNQSRYFLKALMKSSSKLGGTTCAVKAV